MMTERSKIHTDEFIGTVFLEKYKYVYPILRLIISRLQISYEQKKQVYGLLFANDGAIVYDRGYRVVIRYIRAFLLFFSRGIKTIIRSQTADIGNDGIVISNTLICSDRYPSFSEYCRGEKRCIGISVVGYYESNRIIHYMLDNNLFLGVGISGFMVRKCVMQTYRYLRELYCSDKTCADEFGKCDKIFAKLEKSIRKRTRSIGKRMGDKGIGQYITCNQYRIEEILIIMACKERGITTKELSHHQYALFNTVVRQQDMNDRFVNQNEHLFYAEQMKLWSKADKLWVDRYDELRPLLYDEVIIDVAGSPEISEKRIRDNIEKYNTRRVIALMVPDFDFWWAEEANVLPKKKEMIFDQLGLLKEREKKQVIVRYHPADDCNNYGRDLEQIKEYGFEISDSHTESVDQLFAQADVVFGYQTSALTVALNYGARVYAIRGILEDERFDLCGEDIKEVKIEEMCNVDCSRKEGNIARDALDTGRLF